MLEYRKTISKYESIIKILSFNKLSINRVVWNYRNLLKYIFFYLCKKSFFIKFLFSYELLKTYAYSSYGMYNKIEYLYCGLLYLICIRHTKKYYSSFFLSDYNYLVWGNDIYNINYRQVVNWFSFFYKFQHLYVRYNYAIYLWLYGIKLTRIHSMNCSYLPSRKSVMLVLRSPHKDKKSREKFKITKMIANLRIPSFIYEKHFLYPFSNDSCLIKCLINMKKTN